MKKLYKILLFKKIYFYILKFLTKFYFYSSWGQNNFIFLESHVNGYKDINL